MCYISYMCSLIRDLHLHSRTSKLLLWILQDHGKCKGGRLSCVIYEKLWPWIPMKCKVRLSFSLTRFIMNSRIVISTVNSVHHFQCILVCTPADVFFNYRLRMLSKPSRSTVMTLKSRMLSIKVKTKTSTKTSKRERNVLQKLCNNANGSVWKKKRGAY